MLTGYGATGFGDTGVSEIPTAATVKRAGRNRLEAFFDELEAELGFDFDSGQPDHNASASSITIPISALDPTRCSPHSETREVPCCGARRSLE